jgi:hypothetical protein
MKNEQSRQLNWELGFQSDHIKLILDDINKVTNFEAEDFESKPKNILNSEDVK